MLRETLYFLAFLVLIGCQRRTNEREYTISCNEEVTADMIELRYQGTDDPVDFEFRAGNPNTVWIFDDSDGPIELNMRIPHPDLDIMALEMNRVFRLDDHSLPFEIPTLPQLVLRDSPININDARATIELNSAGCMNSESAFVYRLQDPNDWTPGMQPWLELPNTNSLPFEMNTEDVHLIVEETSFEGDVARSYLHITIEDLGFRDLELGEVRLDSIGFQQKRIYEVQVEEGKFYDLKVSTNTINPQLTASMLQATIYREDAKEKYWPSGFIADVDRIFFRAAATETTYIELVVSQYAEDPAPMEGTYEVSLHEVTNISEGSLDTTQVFVWDGVSIITKEFTEGTYDLWTRETNPNTGRKFRFSIFFDDEWVAQTQFNNPGTPELKRSRFVVTGTQKMYFVTSAAEVGTLNRLVSKLD